MATTALDTTLPAVDMLRALRERRVSAVELLDLHLARIQRINPGLNAIVTPADEGARLAAAAADAAYAHGEQRPLQGLPITVKDAIDVQGLPTTSGLPRRKDHVASADAVVVTRLREAGAVILGKTNTPPYTGDWQTDNPLFGRTNNPWDRDRTSGGSTGGGAAAVAAGLSAIELGSDIGGSIRLPAAFCGIYGHRPSETAVPRSGHFPGSSLPSPATFLNVTGPLARGAADLDLALSVVAGPDAGEDVAWSLALPPSRHDRLRDFRVAILPWLPWLPVSAAVRSAMDRVVAALGAAGATAAYAQPDGFGDLREHHLLFLSLMATTFDFNLGGSEERRRRDATALRAMGDEDMTARARGLDAAAGEYLGFVRRREEYRAAYREFFRSWDVLLAPIAPIVAFPHMSGAAEELSVDVDGQSIPYWSLAVYPGVATLSGQPATAFPAGESSGLPVGLQAIGPYLEDRTVLRFAERLATEIGGYRVPPGC